MNPRSAIEQAATQRTQSDVDLHQAVAEAYGTLTIAEIMEAAGVTRPTVYANTPDEARMRAEDVQDEDATDVEFMKGKPYTMKVRRAPEYVPPLRDY
jgi:AcrR family transcriptional regulator